MTRPGDESPPARLVLLPGMAVDVRLFKPQRAAFPWLEVPAWIEPRPREPLGDYARRFAETVGDNRELYVGGVSFGGMVALEMARHLRPRAVFLIASARSSRELLPALHIVERVLRHLPDALLRPLVGPSARFVAWRNGLKGDDAELLHEMATDMSLPFLRWCGPAALTWPGPPAEAIPCPVHQIHGARDPLIPLTPGAPEVVIPDGQHLINMTHAAEVNDFLRRRMGKRRSAARKTAHLADNSSFPRTTPDKAGFGP